MIEKRVEDTISAAQPYMDWHRTLASDLCMIDVDSVEIDETDHFPLAFIELKPITPVVRNVPAWLNSISGTYVGQGKVGKLFRVLSQALPETEFWIVAPDFMLSGKLFYFFNLRNEAAGWRRFNEEQYTAILTKLRTRRARRRAA